MTGSEKFVRVTETPIPGLLVVELPLHSDPRGWFKENWQREVMVASGLPDFCPVQNNVSFNESVGTTRGIHAEPWDKFVSVASGRVFGAWVDMRPGPTFGTSFSHEIIPSRAVFVPRGVGNGFQTLEPCTSYIYLVNDYYDPSRDYTSLNVADEHAAIEWPVPLDSAVMSVKDRNHPRWPDISPVPPRRTLVLGADGQLGRALGVIYADAPFVEFADRSSVDILSSDLARRRNWHDYDTVINAAAFIDVDAAQTAAGRETAWAVNVKAVAALARIARQHSLTLVHISSDYVFDGTSCNSQTGCERRGERK